MTITVERSASVSRLTALGVESWPIKRFSEGEFVREYKHAEACWLSEGEATVIPMEGDAITARAGDLITMPAGSECIWEIHTPTRKHYRRM